MALISALDAGARKFAIPLVVAASLLVCIRGLQATGLLAHPFWLSPAHSGMVGAGLLAVLAALAFAARRIGANYSVLAGVLLLAVAAVFSGLGPVCVVALHLTAAFCIGRRIYQAEGEGRSGLLLSACISLAAGLAALSLLVGFISFFPINSPASYLALLLLPVLVGWKENLHAVRAGFNSWKAAPADAGSTWISVFHVLIALSLLIRLLAVLHPELGHDALAMHLVIAEKLQVDGRFHYDVTQSIWAVMPMASDWQFAISYMLGGEQAARLVNFGADLLIVTLIYQYCASTRSALAGAVAAAVYSSLPLVYLETTSLFAENFWTLWVGGALLAGLGALRATGTHAARASGLMLGTAVAAKVTTIFLAPFFLAIAAGWILHSKSVGFRKLAAFTSVAAAAGFLPYANAWIKTGNPVFPFMNQVFQSPLFDASKAFDNPLFKTDIGWTSLYQVTFESSRFLEAQPGAMGIAFMVLLPAAFAYALLDSRRLRVAALCALAFVALVFHFLSYLRYIMPVVPVLVVMIGIMVAEVSRSSGLLRSALLATVLACIGVGIYLTPNATFHHREISIPPFAGSEAEEAYLDRMRPERRLVQVIDGMNLRKVLWLGSPYIANSHADIEVIDWHGGWAQANEFESLGSVDEMQRWIARKKFDGIAISSNFDTCRRQFVCEFLDAKTLSVFGDDASSLHVPDPAALYARELLVNPGFDQGTAGWAGSGLSVPQEGAVTVSATQAFSQAVKIEPGRRYFLEVSGRCTSDAAEFRSQVNWLGKEGQFMTTNITVVPCTREFRNHAQVVTAPEGATTAMVYASGHLPDKTAEVTQVSFRSQ